MRAVVQRVSSADVCVDGEQIGAIGAGLMVLLGIGEGDQDNDTDYIVRKIATLRIFEDSEGKMNQSVQDIGGQVLLISQFTLYGDCRKGRRPSFVKAMDPSIARAMVDDAVARLRAEGIGVETGRFAADMKVSLLNDGPVTLILDSTKLL